MSQNRYPGVKPFERSEKNIFFGRDQDMENLYELILLEKLVTLFGKSGYGKSSLLNAGILPKFEEALKGSPEYFLPIIVRFGAYVAGEASLSPIERIRQQIAEKLKPTSEMAFIDKLSTNSTLWKEFKQRQSNEHHRFLLIFDQFEELFTYPPEQQNAFKNQLAELLYVAIPQIIRDAAEELPDQEYNRLVKRLDVKAVFAIRSDRLSLLDQLKDTLPAILRIRYELKPLQIEQARMAIVKPAAISSGPIFSTEPFTYTTEAVDTVINNLSGSSSGKQAGIESFLLQMICQEIEYAVLHSQVKQRNEEGWILITEAELPDISNIYDQYYRRNLKLLPETQREAAKLVIEEGLLLVNTENGEARRLSVDGGALIDRYRNQGVDDALLDNLVNAFLLRRERNSTGGFNYEISHDTLMKPIAHSRQERRAEAARLENERRRQEAEARAFKEEERRKAAEKLQKEAEQGRRRAVLFSYLAIALSLIALGAVYLAWRQSSIANDRLEEVLEAKAGEDFQKYNQLLQRAQDLEQLYPQAACTLYVEADSLYQLHTKMDIFADQADLIKSKLQDCN